MNKPGRDYKRLKKKTERISEKASKRASGKPEAKAQKITGRAAERYERVVDRYNKKKR